MDEHLAFLVDCCDFNTVARRFSNLLPSPDRHHWSSCGYEYNFCLPLIWFHSLEDVRFLLLASSRLSSLVAPSRMLYTPRPGSLPSTALATIALRAESSGSSGGPRVSLRCPCGFHPFLLMQHCVTSKLVYDAGR